MEKRRRKNLRQKALLTFKRRKQQTVVSGGTGLLRRAEYLPQLHVRGNASRKLKVRAEEIAVG